MTIFSENNYFSWERFFPPGEFIIIEERENCRIAKRVIVSVKKSIERVFSDLPMVFADRLKRNQQHYEGRDN